MPGLGTNIAIDGSDLPAYANGQRFQVPLPDRRMHPGERLDQSRPPAHAHPPGDGAVERPVSEPGGD
jgi:hypothetical protein